MNGSVLLSTSTLRTLLRSRCRPTFLQQVLSHTRLFIRTASSNSTKESKVDNENANVAHSRFLAEAKAGAKWKGEASLNGAKEAADEFENVKDGKGKLSPTSSHLFKLILPLGSLSHPASTRTTPSSSTDTEKKHSTSQDPPVPPPTVFLLHPSQPLSHVSRLVLSTLAPATPIISFRSTSINGQAFQWSDSTDVGDFIRDAARSAKFSICLTYGHPASVHPSVSQNTGRHIPVNEDSSSKANAEEEIQESVIDVEVPTFAGRTRFLRKRLNSIEKKLQEMEGLKAECDREAHRGAKRMAMGGFGMLVVYWAAVARLTFWDYGWDVMEPITYLSGLSTVILGYLWFLYQGREVSYTSVLARSISARREALYKARGLDIEQWMGYVTERKNLRQEIRRIAEDYDRKVNGENEGDDAGDTEGVGEDNSKLNEGEVEDRGERR